MDPLARYESIVDDAVAFREACAQPLPYLVRVNTIKSTVERATTALDEAGVGWSDREWHPHLLELETEAPGRTWPYFLGWLHGQEAVSAIPPVVLDPGPDDRVWDACAAPGSKATQLAALMDDDGLVIANDVNLGRLSALRTNAERLGVTGLAVTNQDARAFSLKPFGFDEFDAALVDAPCSGEGTVRKNPAALEDWTEGFLEDIATTQVDLLRRAVQATRPGGTVVYSTCSFAPEENEAVLDQVLVSEDCRTVGLELPLQADPGITQWQGETFHEGVRRARRFWPHQNDTGGFFCAKLAVGG